MKLDAIDKKILKLLQTDAKLTTKEIALKTGLSATAVFERVKKLERTKVITGYTAILDTNLIERNFAVYCFVKLLQHTKEYVLNFERQAFKLPEVLECFHVSGDYDYILKIHVKDMQEYRNFMVSKLTNIDGIGSTHSSFVINEVKYSRVFDLDNASI